MMQPKWLGLRVGLVSDSRSKASGSPSRLSLLAQYRVCNGHGAFHALQGAALGRLVVVPGWMVGALALHTPRDVRSLCQSPRAEACHPENHEMD